MWGRWRRLIAGMALLAMPIAAVGSTPTEILALPGWTEPMPSRMYSGYLRAKNSRLFYIYVEAEDNEKQTAPLTVWFNGGPGCSSLGGFWTENGPFGTDDGANLWLREFRWSRFTNMLWFENPVGVGFSYSTDDNYNTGDAITAEENLLALQDFFSTFPALKSVDLYLAGESYAGVYIPMLSQAILKAQDAGKWAGLPLLKGIAVGNGCTGNDIGACSDACEGLKFHMQFLDSLAYIAPPTKATIETKCEWSKCDKNALNDTNNGITQDCIDAVNSALGALAAVNIYNVYATCTVNDGCGNGGNSSGSSLDVRGEQATLGQFTPMNAVESFRRLQQIATSKSRRRLNSDRFEPGIDDDAFPDWAASEATDEGGPTGCIDSTTATKYMMNAAVQTALHIRTAAPSGCWSFCSTAPSWYYSRTMGDEPKEVYPDLWGRIDVLIYNGGELKLLPGNSHPNTTPLSPRPSSLFYIFVSQPFFLFPFLNHPAPRPQTSMTAFHGQTTTPGPWAWGSSPPSLGTRGFITRTQ